MNRRQASTAFVVALITSLAAAEDAAEKTYFLSPVTTDLQRFLLAPTVTAYGIVNANALIRDGHIDPAALDLPAFRTELAALAKSHPGTIIIYCRFQNWRSQPAAEELLEAALTQFCRKAGFERVTTGKTYTSDTWKQEIQSLDEATRRRTDGDEPLVQDDRVRAFAVRTRLSRLLTGNADCVVTARQAIDGRMPEIPEETLHSIGQCIAQLGIENKQKVNLRFSSTKAGERVIEQFLARQGGQPSLADRFSKSLGFESSTVSHTPCGGAPESLLGKSPPDFTLESLGGSKINLHDAIDGRVALITFWGVACGPCRQEAPHLSTLFKRYKDAGFTLLAVNAYDESRDTVAEYVRKESLAHPIALMGRQVARDNYSVGAYPTGFWINHKGQVVDYVIGFEPGDEARIAATIERMLKDRAPTSR